MGQILHPLLVLLASCIQQDLARPMAYLKEENRSSALVWPRERVTRIVETHRHQAVTVIPGIGLIIPGRLLRPADTVPGGVVLIRMVRVLEKLVVRALHSTIT